MKKRVAITGYENKLVLQTIDMKKQAIFLVILLSSFYGSFSQEFDFKGRVVDKFLNPLNGIGIKNTRTSATATSDEKGEFTIKVQPNDNLEFSGLTLAPIVYPVTVDNFIRFTFDNAQLITKKEEKTGTVSANNYWVGARIGYNLLAGDYAEDMFVGSASVMINPFDNPTYHHTFGIVGNLGNFRFNKDPEEDKNIQKAAQSVNGLSAGLTYINESRITGSKFFANANEKPTSYFRKYISPGARVITFKSEAPDSDPINLAQFVTDIGFEFEQSGFKKGGRLTVSTGLNMMFFSKSKYKEITGEDKGSLFSFNGSIILPFSKSFGLYINGTFPFSSKPIYTVGVIFKIEE